MSSKRWPSMLAALAVLFSGLTNAHAHVHLCFDGQDAPASVHLADGNHHSHHSQHSHGSHGHSGHAQDHDDLDVDVPSPALAKTVKYDDLAAIVTFTAWAASFGAPKCVAPTSDSGITAPPHPPFSRPPLRGPPL
jgi:hypothetical protein